MRCEFDLPFECEFDRAAKQVKDDLFQPVVVCAEVGRKATQLIINFESYFLARGLQFNEIDTLLD